eukprot:evm.model.scf_1246.5 EVM.evm.TU.scf_1246.5   scf_1246:28421-33119(-)
MGSPLLGRPGDMPFSLRPQARRVACSPRVGRALLRRRRWVPDGHGRVRAWGPSPRHGRTPSAQPQSGRQTRTLQASSTAAGEASAGADEKLRGDGLVFAPGQEGQWDGSVGHPVVRYTSDADGPCWFMWYTGCAGAPDALTSLMPTAGSIGVAISADGVNWERGCVIAAGTSSASSCVLKPNDDWWAFDTECLTVSDVQVLDMTGRGGVFYMYYTGANTETVVTPEGIPGLESGLGMEGLRLRPGLAMSQDGFNWPRIEGSHYTGALLDAGEEGEWDSLFISGPQVVARGPKNTTMYYHSYDTSGQKYCIGLATSQDGLKWQKEGKVFEGSCQEDAWDCRGASFRCVVRDPDRDQFLMFYEGLDKHHRRSIGLAVSTDGYTNWECYPEPILKPSPLEDRWDCGEVGAPWAVSMANGRWRLYYSGKSTSAGGRWEGIGLALSVAAGPKFHGVPVEFKRRTKSAGGS